MSRIAEGRGATRAVGNMARLRDRASNNERLTRLPPRDAGGLRRFERDQEIFGEADPADFFYEVVSGAVRTYKLLRDGRRQIDAFHLPGDIFGIEAGCRHRFSAEAVDQVLVRAIRRRDLHTLARTESDLAGRLVEAIAHSLARAQEHMLLLGRKFAREKIASFLLGYADRCRGAAIIELPMSRIDIADHLGLTIETVSRTLSQFQREMLIELPSTRRVIVLRDAAALRQLDAGDADERPLLLSHDARASISRVTH